MRMPGRSKWEEPPDPDNDYWGLGYCQRHHRWYGGEDCPRCEREIENHLLTLEEGDA